MHSRSKTPGTGGQDGPRAGTRAEAACARQQSSSGSPKSAPSLIHSSGWSAEMGTAQFTRLRVRGSWTHEHEAVWILGLGRRTTKRSGIAGAPSANTFLAAFRRRDSCGGL